MGFAATTPVAVQREDRYHMTTEIDEFRQSLVAAVQAELERHASAVVAEVDRLRETGEQERAAIRAEFTQQIAALSQAFEQSRTQNDSSAETVRRALEQRIEESEARQLRRVDDATSGIEGVVREAARPMLADVSDQQAALAHKVDGLDTNLRKFDEQAARMVTYFNDVSQQMEQRQDELSESLRADIAGQLETLTKMVEENASAVRGFQNEVGQSVTSKLNDAEDRFNTRLLAAESHMKDDPGQKIADIDAQVGRVSAGLDETMKLLNDRIAGVDDLFVEVGKRIDEVEKSVQGVDQESLDELKEKMSTAAGEAMLVRIEMERLEKGVNERSDELVVRLTEVETQLVDATMDVSTAVQLDRLEEIERSLLELDPTKFVLKDSPPGAFAPPSGAVSNEILKNDGGGADDTSGFDPSAIMAAEEHRHDPDPS